MFIQDIPKIPSEDNNKQVSTEDNVEPLNEEMIKEPSDRNNNKDSDYRINESLSKEDESTSNTDEITSNFNDMNIHDEEHNSNDNELNATTDDSSFDNTREIGRFMEFLNDDNKKDMSDKENSNTRKHDDSGEFSSDDNIKDSEDICNTNSIKDEQEPVVDAFEYDRDKVIMKSYFKYLKKFTLMSKNKKQLFIVKVILHDYFRIALRVPHPVQRKIQKKSIP